MVLRNKVMKSAYRLPFDDEESITDYFRKMSVSRRSFRFRKPLLPNKPRNFISWRNTTNASTTASTNDTFSRSGENA
ncbi:MAG: hypothetical protein ACI9UU_002692 [Candidatus Azotimanducaceae bacterium]|jgi:hypothetical protein